MHILVRHQTQEIGIFTKQSLILFNKKIFSLIMRLVHIIIRQFAQPKLNKCVNHIQSSYTIHTFELFMYLVMKNSYIHIQYILGWITLSKLYITFQLNNQLYVQIKLTILISTKMCQLLQEKKKIKYMINFHI